MKKLIFIMMLVAIELLAQSGTNNVRSVATIYATNSPVTINSSLTVDSRTVSVTNSSTIYQIGTTPGMTLSVTNIGPALGSSNVTVFGSGILTNKFTIP